MNRNLGITVFGVEGVSVVYNDGSFAPHHIGQYAVIYQDNRGISTLHWSKTKKNALKLAVREDNKLFRGELLHGLTR